MRDTNINMIVLVVFSIIEYPCRLENSLPRNIENIENEKFIKRGKKLK